MQLATLAGAGIQLQAKYRLEAESQVASAIVIIHIITQLAIWGKPECAPHKCKVRVACLSVFMSVFLSVRTFVTQKYTRIVVIYGVSLVVDNSIYGAFGELLCMPTFNKLVAANNKNKQVLILRKQVYQSLIKIISLALLL